MKKKDILIGLVTGFLTAFVWVPVLIILNALPWLGGKVWYLLVVVPMLFIIGLALANWISRWLKLVRYLAKFLIIGFLNTGIDFAIFNFLIFRTGIEVGREIALFKAVSFVIAVINSFFWNKYWSFEAGGSDRQGTEFAKYFFITLIGAFLNIGVTWGIVNLMPVVGGFSQLAWDNIAAVAATIVSLIWNFAGYRFFVFRKNRI